MNAVSRYRAMRPRDSPDVEDEKKKAESDEDWGRARRTQMSTTPFGSQRVIGEKITVAQVARF